MRLLTSLVVGGLTIWLGRIYFERRENRKNMVGMLSRMATRLMRNKMIRRLWMA